MERITLGLLVLTAVAWGQVQTFINSETPSDATADLDEVYDWYMDYGMNGDLPFTRLTEISSSERMELEVPAESFLQRAAANALSRDEDDYMEDRREVHRKEGKTQWLLVTSFEEGRQGSGKVWAVPTANYTLGFTLVGGLTRPTGVCYDGDHQLLYVCDPGEHAIYQYDISRRHFAFELRSELVATIVSQGEPQDCSLSSSGDLYYLDANSTYRVNYSDLWAGYADQQVLFAADSQEFASPIAIAHSRNDTMYFVNNDRAGELGLLNSLDKTGQVYRTLVREDKSAWGLAVSPTGAYFSVIDGTVSAR